MPTTGHLHQLQCSKINVQRIFFGTHYRLENGSLGFLETLHKEFISSHCFLNKSNIFIFPIVKMNANLICRDLLEADCQQLPILQFFLKFSHNIVVKRQ